MSQSPLVDGLLYGRLDGIPSETVFLFARTGLIHLFSASGFHMGVALFLAAGAAKLVTNTAAPVVAHPRGAPALTFFFSLGMMLYFANETEWSSPMVRAFSFSTLMGLARFLEIRPTPGRLFLLSLAAAALFGRGSWLSYALSAISMGALLAVRPARWWAYAIAPWAASLPLCVYYFQLFSGAAPLWNLTIGALIGFTVLPLAIVNLFLGSAGCRSEWIAGLAEKMMNLLVAVLAEGDARVGLAYWVAPQFFLAVSAVLFLAYFAFRRSRRAGLALGLVASMATALLPAPTLAALRVGQGDAIFLRLAGGSTGLVDTGPPGFRGRISPAARSLEGLGIGAVDDLFFSHLDRDHSGGTGDILGRHPVRGAAWLRPEHLADQKALGLLAELERARVPVRFYGEKPRPGLRCWLPPAVNSNESSAVCYAELSGGRSIWLTGDAGFASEVWLLGQGPLPKADILKVAHHGSRFSGGPDFLRAVGARTALLSVGKNRYGHPSPDAVARLREAGYEIRRTDAEGTLDYW